MKILVGNKTYSNYVPYKKDIGTYKKLANYMLECGFGYWNSDDLYKLWEEISEKHYAGWLAVPESLEQFKEYLSCLEIEEYN